MRLTISFALSAFLVLSGCAAKFHLASPEHPYEKEGALFKRKLEAANRLPDLEVDYYKKDTSNEDRKRIRDQIVFTLLELIEEYQRRFNSNLYGGVSAFNAGSEITAGILTAGATISTVTDTTRLLSGLATMVIGANASVGKNFLQGRGADLIIDRMDALRVAKRVEILGYLRRGADYYPLGQALLDVQDYARAGSIPSAIRAISQDNAEAAKKAETKLQQLQLPEQVGSNPVVQQGAPASVRP